VLIYIIGPERLRQGSNFPEQNTKRVHIGLQIVILAKNYLRRHVSSRTSQPSHLKPICILKFPAKPKVEKLDGSANINANVVWLEIPVNDSEATASVSVCPQKNGLMRR